ncbi:trehalose-phosphatase [Glacieibacterium sp.]|uniref:trehalose-phosphatase n=1 Tax=Glacieibacterium sp. TaxID=2860237 RepID=UPI003B009B94
MTKPIASTAPRDNRPAPGLVDLQQASLFLDFDGTLVGIAAHPGAVQVSDRLRGLLARLTTKFPGRVAIVSGRPIAELKQFLGSTALVFAGSHGVEMLWPDGTASEPPRPDDLGPVIQEMQRLQKVHSAIVIERKPFGVALHYRAEPQAEDACRRLATGLAKSTGLTLQSGKMVFELRAPGADKGGALRTLLRTPAMAGSMPIFIGDDDTDEAAFVVAAEMGGFGILVGADRPTAAHYRLDDVEATLAWLETACGEDS